MPPAESLPAEDTWQNIEGAVRVRGLIAAVPIAAVAVILSSV
jgi:hypothetical protein